MNQSEQDIKERLKRRKEQYAKQQLRLEKLESTMHNTEEDIEQLKYALEELKRIRKGNYKRRTICNKQIAYFFTRLCGFFDSFQHRYHMHLNYRLICLIVNARYRFRSRNRTPGREYLSEATILNYFKYERNAIGSTVAVKAGTTSIIATAGTQTG